MEPEYPEAFAVALIGFIVLIQVLFLNLATGLAIDDVKVIKRHAESEKLATKAREIYHSEKVLLLLEQYFLHKLSAVCGIERKVNLLGLQKRFYALPVNIKGRGKWKGLKTQIVGLKTPHEYEHLDQRSAPWRCERAMGMSTEVEKPRMR